MVRKLTRYIGEYKKDSILAPIFVTLEVIMDVVIPYLMANMIDFGIEPGDKDVIIRTGIFMLLSTVVSLITGVLSGKYASQASAGFAKNLRRGMYYQIQNYSFANIDKFSSASLVTRLTTDVTNVQMAYMMIVRVAVRGPLMLVLSMIMAFQVNAELALIFLIAAPIVGTGLIVIAKLAHPLFERVFKTYDKLNRVVQENVRGIRVVKSFVREDHEDEKFKAVSQDIYQDFSKAEKIVAFNSPVMQFSIYSCMILLSWLGAKLIVSSEMTTGELMTMMTYAAQILMGLMTLSMVFVMIIISQASIERIVEVLDEQSDLQNGENPVKTVNDGSVEFRDVSFSYAKDPHKLCLLDVNLKIESGQTVGIIGGTGSAKSSLVQLIPRLYDATKGTVLVSGVDVREYDLQTLRENVAMVLQKNVLFSGTIKENLRWGNPDASDEELVRVCRLAQADDFIRTFPDGYDTYIEQGGTNVSGGQKQRLCIARALLKQPQILILDDSTSAVDTKTDALIRQAFKTEIPDTTKFIIAQRISSVEDADVILVMEGGRVTAAGTHEQLLHSSEIYREVYESQQKGGASHDVA